MIFTQEQINEIRARLALGGIRDSQFPSATLPLQGNETIAIVQDGENRQIRVEDLYEEISIYTLSKINSVPPEEPSEPVEPEKPEYSYDFKVYFPWGNWDSQSTQGVMSNDKNLFIDVIRSSSGFISFQFNTLVTGENIKSVSWEAEESAEDFTESTIGDNLGMLLDTSFSIATASDGEALAVLEGTFSNSAMYFGCKVEFTDGTIIRYDKLGYLVISDDYEGASTINAYIGSFYLDSHNVLSIEEGKEFGYKEIEDTTSKYSIFSSTEHGSIEVAGDKTTASEGELVSFRVASAEGYSVVSVSVRESDSDNEINIVNEMGTYKFTMPAKAVAISAAFTQNVFAITKNAGSNGSITITGNATSARAGSTVQFTVSGNTYYGVDSVVVKNASTNAAISTTFVNGTYSFTMPSAAVSVNATFTKNAASISSVTPTWEDYNGGKRLKSVAVNVSNGTVNGNVTAQVAPVIGGTVGTYGSNIALTGSNGTYTGNVVLNRVTAASQTGYSVKFSVPVKDGADGVAHTATREVNVNMVKTVLIQLDIVDDLDGNSLSGVGSPQVKDANGNVLQFVPTGQRVYVYPNITNSSYERVNADSANYAFFFNINDGKTAIEYSHSWDSAKGAITFIAPDYDLEVDILAAVITYELDIPKTTNGTVTVSANGQTVTSSSAQTMYLPAGTEVTVTDSPATNYVTSSIKANNTALVSGSTVTVP